MEAKAMDDLADSLGQAFGVSSNPNDPSRPHPRFSQYKGHGEKGASQEVRRERTLQIQKKRRDDYLSVARALVTGNVQDDESDEGDEIDWMDDSAWTEYDEDENFVQDDEGEHWKRRSSNVKKLLGRLNLKMSYRNQLMLSEWLVDVPKTFETNWLAMPVPEGRRSLIIAGQGKTKHFSKSGAFINQFPSLLPGGGVTILDTIFSQLTQTYYVLDCMMWKGFSFYGCDTECRWFWISSKLSEDSDFGIKSRRNPYIFKMLPNFSCKKESLEKVFGSDTKFDFDPLPLDGILFYHKMVHYLPGVTPLVGWLKGYMLTEMLNIPISRQLESQRPNNYATMNKFIDDYNKNEASKKGPEIKAIDPQS